jgi:hypothetical protein
VLDITINRNDIPNVRKDGGPIKPAFEINGDLFFQPLSDGSVMFNGDLCFQPEELNPAIDAMTSHSLVFQAEHEHLFGLEPMVISCTSAAGARQQRGQWPRRHPGRHRAMRRAKPSRPSRRRSASRGQRGWRGARDDRRARRPG